MTDIAVPGPLFTNVLNTDAINDTGTVAFLANLRSGGLGLFTSQGQAPNVLYVTGGRFTDFERNVLVNNAGTVAFVADLAGGDRAIFTGAGGPVTTIATTLDDSPFASLNRLISLNDAGVVAFPADLRSGGQGIFIGNGGSPQLLAVTGGPFQDFITVAINNVGTVAFSADLAGGGRGIFTGPDPEADKVIATGDDLFGSTVRSLDSNVLALQGLNDAGQVAIEATLADGRQVIARADPMGETGHRLGKTAGITAPAADLAAASISRRRMAPSGEGTVPGSRTVSWAVALSPGQLSRVVPSQSPPTTPETDAVRDHFFAAGTTHKPEDGRWVEPLETFTV